MSRVSVSVCGGSGCPCVVSAAPQHLHPARGAGAYQGMCTHSKQPVLHGSLHCVLRSRLLIEAWTQPYVTTCYGMKFRSLKHALKLKVMLPTCLRSRPLVEAFTTLVSYTHEVQMHPHMHLDLMRVRHS